MTVLYLLVIALFFWGLYIWYNTLENNKEVMSFRQAFELTDMPIVTFYEGDKKFNFLLDTGSIHCMINKSIIDSNQISYNRVESGGFNVFGMEGNPVSVKPVHITLYYNERAYEDDFLVNDLSATFNTIKMSKGITLHGILGSKFFDKYKYILDFKKMEFKR